jgi:hypothetical protein
MNVSKTQKVGIHLGSEPTENAQEAEALLDNDRMEMIKKV